MRFAEKRFFTESGSPLHVLYSPKVEKDGSVELVESGVENFQEYIDSFKESTDLSTILARVGAGETELLFKRPGSYGDFTKLPQTYAEALQLQIDSNRLFGSLPAEVRHKFNDDPGQFFAQSGTEDWFHKIEAVLPDEVKSMIKPDVSVQPVVKEEVKE